MKPTFPNGPKVVLRCLLPPRIAEPLLREIESSFERDYARRGRLRAYLGVWAEALSPSVLAIALREGRRRIAGFGIASIVREIRFAFRSLRKAPGYSFAVVSALALGIGLSVAQFTAVDAVLLRNPTTAYRGGDVVSFSWNSRGRWNDVFSAADYLDLKASSKTVDQLHAYSPRSFTVGGNVGARKVSGATVSSGMLEMLGAQPLLGRFFHDRDDVNGAAPVVVLGHAYWLREFEGRRDIVGRLMEVNGGQREIVGVAPRWLQFRPPGTTTHLIPGDPIDLFLPNAFAPWRLRVRQAYSYNLLGRLTDGVDVDQAAAELRTIIAGVSQDVPIAVRSLKEHLVGYTRTPLLLLSGAVFLVYLLAVVNAASLVAVRRSARNREVAVRRALGSGTFRAYVVGLTESVVLTVFAGVASIFLAFGLLRIVDVAAFAPMIREQELLGAAISGAATLSGVAAIVLIVLPFFWTAPRDGSGSLRSSGGMRLSRREGRMQHALVAGQLALALVVLAGAATLTRSVSRMRSVDLGIDVEQVATYRLSLPEEYESPGRIQRFLTEHLNQLRARPDIAEAGAVNFLPFRDHGGISGPLAAGERSVEVVQRKAVTPGLLEALGVDRIAGRAFTDEDDSSRVAVALLSASTAIELFGETNVVDRIVRNADNSEIVVVGVVEDVRPERPDRAPVPTMYVPAFQDDFTELSVVVRFVGSRSPLAEARTLLAELDSRVPVFEQAGLRQLIDGSITSERMIATLLQIFALVAGMIGLIGVYTTRALVVTASRSELGMRMALGATARTILFHVIRGGFRTAVIGVAAGLLLYAGVSRLLAAYLFEVHAMNVLSLVLAAGFLILLSLVGSLVPAYRASVIDPLESLRSE